jgi:protein-disulfide isomerase
MTTPLIASQPEDKPAPVRRSSLALILFLVIGFAAGLTVGYLSWGTSANQAAPAAAIKPAATPSRLDVPIGTAPIWGSVNAPVTIIEFSDYECPYCKKWHNEIWPQIQQAYPNQVRLVYKDFPLLQSHPNASPAAAAARCATDQGKYWQFHDLIFASSSLSQQVYDSIAARLSLDVTQWKSCIAAKKYDPDILSDYSYGQQLGITGTPTFFINGLPLVGAQPFAAFKQVIDKELVAKK